MSSALDDDTRETLAAGRDTAGDMLRAAQKDLQKVFIVWLVGFLGTFYSLRLWVWPFFKRVTQARMDAATAESVVIIAQTPFDVILLQAKIGLMVGTIVALPVFIYFAQDALKRRGAWPTGPLPLWKVGPLVVLGLALFVAGVLYGYFVFFPFTFEFLASNAIAGGFKPRYSIVLWAQFIFLLSMSFGLAAELPLVMSALSYTGIVPYEVFRDYWRHAVVLIFVFGAVFSPPDPFTQIMWAFPLLILYGASLYLSKAVVTTKRGSEHLDFRRLVRDRWNFIAGVGVAAGAAVYLFYAGGGVAAVNRAIGAYTHYRLREPGAALPLTPESAALVHAAVWALVGAVLTALYLVAREIESLAASGGRLGEPAAIDVGELDAAGVRAAPVEAFADLSEDEALETAREAMDVDEPGKAQAILDRFDQVQEAEAAEASSDGAGSEEAAGTAEPGRGLGDRASRAGERFFAELGEDADEDVEEEIGGYYRDVRFVAESLSSKSFRIMAVFMVVMAGTFAWLYSGGIRTVKEDFLRRLPAGVVPDPEAVGVVALHPVEVLVFEVKFSVLIAILAVLPVVAFYAWPALRTRGVVYGHRYVIFGWVGALTAGLLGGFAFGYSQVAPTVISFLVADAAGANLVITYRITNFFWLIFFTTAGIGLLIDVPVLMILLNTAGVSYRSMRDRWREVTVGIMTFAAIFTPASITTMFLVTVPLMVAYGAGLVVLFPLTFGGYRDLSRTLGLKRA